MAGYGDLPFGLSDIKITNAAGDTQVDLPNAATFNFSERNVNGIARGDDKIASVAAFSEGVDWELSCPGMPLEAYALLTGRTASETGVTPNRVNTLTVSASQPYPYVKIYGKSIGDDATDDVHVLLYKCKITETIRAAFQDAQHLDFTAQGIGIDDDVNGVMDIIQNESAATLPSS